VVPELACQWSNHLHGFHTVLGYSGGDNNSIANAIPQKMRRESDESWIGGDILVTWTSPGN
jgi:hypothetical protein